MEEVILSEMTTRDKAYKIGGLILGILLIYSFTTDLHWGKLVMGLIFVLVSGYAKEMTVQKDGIAYTYNYYFVIKRHDKMNFNELDEIVTIRDGRNHLIYFVKGQTSERLSMPPEKLDEIINFIKKHAKVKIREEKLWETE